MAFIFTVLCKHGLYPVPKHFTPKGDLVPTEQSLPVPLPQPGHRQWLLRLCISREWNPAAVTCVSGLHGVVAGVGTLSCEGWDRSVAWGCHSHGRFVRPSAGGRWVASVFWLL